MKTLLLLPICLLFQCCSGYAAAEKESRSTPLDKVVTYPVRVDLPTALQNVDEKVSLSTFIESIEYIPLKLKDNLLGEDLVYCVYDEKAEKIILSDIGRVIVVDKKGNFQNEIGNSGQGPGEYIYLSTISIDPEKENVYLYDGGPKVVRKYTYDGKFQGKVCRYDNFLIKGVYWANNYFLSQCEMFTSHRVKQLDSFFGYALIDTSGNFIDKTPNLCAQIKDITSEKYAGFLFGFGYSVNFCKDVALFLEAGLADTVYTVNNNKIVPRYLLKYGDDRPDVNKIWSMNNDIREAEKERSLLIMDPAYETSRYFFIRASKKDDKYIICHDKYENRSFSVKYKEDPIIAKEYLSVKIGFRNDIDGGIDTYLRSISTLGNYWVSCISAYAMKTLLTDKHFASRKDVLDKAAQEKLKALVKNLNEEDDQILILMKVKNDAK